jgi:hypothetical protein
VSYLKTDAAGSLKTVVRASDFSVYKMCAAADIDPRRSLYPFHKDEGDNDEIRILNRKHYAKR